MNWFSITSGKEQEFNFSSQTCEEIQYPSDFNKSVISAEY
jgi:hypothetical protein